MIAATLTLSAAGIAGTFLHEEFVSVANVPVKGDPCTGGYGATTNKDGSPVKCGQRFTPAQAVDLAVHHAAKDEAVLRKCVKNPVSQGEWDILVGHAYQYGAGVTCKSTMVKEINLGNYAKACEGYLLYKKVRGHDCSTPGDKVCSGVWERSKARHSACMAEQKRIDILGSEKAEETPVKPFNPWGWVLGIAFGLVLLGGTGYGVYRWKKK